MVTYMMKSRTVEILSAERSDRRRWSAGHRRRPAAKWHATGWPWPRSISCRLLVGADLLRHRAAGAEPAARRRVDRARHVAREHDALASALGRRGRPRAPPTAAPACTGAPARSYTSSRVPISTILPRYITATRSEMWRTTDRSWATNTYDRPSRSCRSSSRLMTPACTLHVERRHGLVEHDQLRVRARARGRCRCAGAGRRRTRAGTGCRARGSGPRGSSSSATRSCPRPCSCAPCTAQRLADDLVDLPARVERRIRVLEHDLHLAAQRAQSPWRQADELLALELHGARRRARAAAGSHRAVVDLPHPLSPTRPSVSPRSTSNEMPRHRVDEADGAADDAAAGWGTA